MTDETRSSEPEVRDPQAPANVLAQPASQWTAFGSADADAINAPVVPPASGSRLGDTFSGLEAVSDADDTRGLRALGSLRGATANSLSNDDASDDIERGLARLDPLTVRPRTSSRVLCVILAVMMIALAFGAWWLGVRTEDGQAYEDMVFSGFKASLPGWASVAVTPFLKSIHTALAIPVNLTVVCSVVLAIIAVVVMIVRKRWWLIGQSAVFAVLCFAATFLKEVLPRPFIINTQSQSANSAPSGHTMLAAAAGVLLLAAVPRAWRAVAAIIAAAYAMIIGLSVIAGAWHRPSDVVMGFLLVGAIALLALACTRTSGMDEPGKRASSASVQIVGTVMITAGIICDLYAAYIIWQIEPGLSLSARWASGGAHVSTFCLIAGTAMLTFGVVLAMRQLTASPLTKLGLVGAPPAPPRR
ncbi:PAP2 family protein [Bifidobacterium goeldii]|uniref:PAP2 family protein n=1 Tax=Bifidobacterium goeldii TaxID=2306975 RepID=A0A430FL43_9BIFI|nr:phosphatase PAP2 family protein [Bifidobacterium goeldii]RSX53614.1 PAP2 family protein [Bifidobacterium goeldii]